MESSNTEQATSQPKSSDFNSLKGHVSESALRKMSPEAVKELADKFNKSEKKIKVLAYCDSPTVSTGFGNVSRAILKRLYNTGKYDIIIWGINYWGVWYDQFEYPYKIYPAALSGSDLYGREAFIKFMGSIDFDILWSLNDPFIISSFIPEAVMQYRKQAPDKHFKWITYMPIDTPHFKRSWLVPFMSADFPVAYNDWTFDQLTKAAPELKRKLRSIYHGVDPTEYYQLPENEIQLFKKDYWKDWLKDDTFLVINVNRNQQRKDMFRSLKAFKKFKDMRPNAHLYLHCNIGDVGGNILEMAAQVGLQPRQDFSYPDPEKFHAAAGMNVETLNKIYNAADAVMSTTLGEGCGLSSYEAMAVGKPIIMPNNTALIETMANNRGMPVNCGNNENLWVVMPNDNSIMRPLTDVNDMAEKLAKLYDDKQLRDDIAKRGHDWIMTKTWDIVCKEWEKVFDEAAKLVIDLKAGRSMPVGDIDDTGVAAAGS